MKGSNYRVMEDFSVRGNICYPPLPKTNIFSKSLKVPVVTLGSLMEILATDCYDTFQTKEKRIIK